MYTPSFYHTLKDNGFNTKNETAYLKIFLFYVFDIV